MNSDERLDNSVSHTEIAALARAEERISSFSLDRGEAPHVRYSSCEPCAMCLGAIVWSGVRRVVHSAHREDAERIGFQRGRAEGESAGELRRGTLVWPAPRRCEARAVLTLHQERGGPICNG